jgi:RsbT co-antagonist protein rsbRD N-terminal domain
MNIEEVLHENQAAIVADACRAIGRLEHYRRDGEQETKRRVEMLYQYLIAAVRALDLKELRTYAAQIARERVATGFAIAEVVAAFSAIEEAIWHHALIRLPRYDQAWGIGLACTVLAHGRAELARAVEAGSPGTGVPPIDLTPLFDGVASALSGSPEEKVFPV